MGTLKRTDGMLLDRMFVKRSMPKNWLQEVHTYTLKLITGKAEPITDLKEGTGEQQPRSQATITLSKVTQFSNTNNRSLEELTI